MKISDPKDTGSKQSKCCTHPTYCLEVSPEYRSREGEPGRT